MRILLSIALLCVSQNLMADEGMWTFDKFPLKTVQKKYGADITKEWLENTQLSSVRLANGCSGSFVSKKGLVLTNHHCVVGCVEQLSTAKKDYIKNGFVAADEKAELTCPAFEVNRLLQITDVTAKVKKATQGLKGEAFNKARKATNAQLEKECSAGKSEFRCEVISLYHGGLYHLYKYQRYQDVRLVFAPESSAAAFGGDPDNFNFPRYSLDFSFLRVYENGKPLDNAHYFKWSKEPLKEKDVTFVTGHPGRTSRLLTVAQLENLRDYSLVSRIALLSELRGFLMQYQKRGPEQKRTAFAMLQGVENSLKVMKGQQQALVDKNFFNKLVKKEEDFKAKVAKNPKLKKQYGQTWKELEALSNQSVDMADTLNYIVFNTYGSKLFKHAQTLVQGSVELTKPDGERYEEYSESRLPQLKQSLFSTAPIYKDLETALVEFYLIKTREALSPDHPFVKKIMGSKSPALVAKELVEKSKLADVKVRKQLWDGGAKAVAASNDPMIKFAQLVDSDVRASRKKYEDQIESATKAASENLAQAQFEIYGTETYPDATFSLRISYGQVMGYEDGGQTITPITQMKNVFKRHTGSEPFALPPSWLKAESQISKTAPFNFVTTNDIIGGNSGSPILNKNAEIVGVVFDGNIHSLGGAFGFDPNKNRAISVQSGGMLESLKTIYKNDRLVKEITTL